MSRFYLLTILICTFSTAQARWTEVATTDTSKVYIDLLAIQRDGYTVRAWELWNLNSPEVVGGKSYGSWTAYNEYDCMFKKSKILEMKVYSGEMGSGQLVMNPTPSGQWDHAIRPSIGMDIINRLCKM